MTPFRLGIVPCVLERLGIASPSTGKTTHSG